MPNNPVKLFQSSVEFESFGNSVLAYLRPVQSDDMNTIFPDGPELPSGLDLWGLFAADGQPIAVADDKSDLISDAENRNLLTVGIH